MKNALMEVCQKYIRHNDRNVVLSEPYIPYIPEEWNKVLVLGESQNLSGTYLDYVGKLNSMNPVERMQRLDLKENGDIGIYPWDDGSLKLAIESSMNVQAENTAVSNAVLWSLLTESGANKNPSKELTEYSVEIWRDFLSIMNPDKIVCSGKIAGNILEHTGWAGKKLSLRHPAKTSMSRISGMFNENDLLERYPEVKKVVDMRPEWVKSYRANKILFACHAVSLNEF